MPTGLVDVLHDASVLHRFVDFIGEYCRQQTRSQTYVGSAAVFFRYVEQLAAGIQDELRREIERATKRTPRLATLRRNMRTYRGYLRLLHALIKPAADAHSLTIPGPLVDLASQQLQKVAGMANSRLLILLTPEFMYFQRPHTDIKSQAREIEGFIPSASFPPKLGFIEIPYSQGPSFFTNLAIYHEIGHFVYEELSHRNPSHRAFKALASAKERCLNKAFSPRASKVPAGTRNAGQTGSNRQAFALAEKILENWTQEIFCDLFALRLIGPAFSFALIEMIGMLGVSRTQCVTFNTDHPAPACRFAEHVKLLRDDEWWKEIEDLQAEQRQFLQELANIPIGRYEFFMDDSRRGPRRLLNAFVTDLAPAIKDLVCQLTTRAVPSVERFRRVRHDIQKAFRAGVVPLTDTPDRRDPVCIINAAFCFYLTAVTEVVKRFEEPGHENDVALHSKWKNRVEMWTMKAIEDSQVMQRYKDVQRYGPF
jgi:hypothetical protein